MNEQIDSILEQSLSQTAGGKARVESCLLAYPALAGELGPLLRTAEDLRSLPTPDLPAAARDRIRATVLGSVRAPVRPSLAPLLARWQRPRGSRGLRLALAGVSAVLAIVLIMVSVVHAAGTTLPGAPLYPVKRASETAWLWLTPAGDKPLRHLYFAQRRLDELEAQTHQGTWDPSLLQALQDEVEAAMAAAEDLPPLQAAAALEEIVAFSNHQQQELAMLIEKAPAENRPALAAALRASQDQQDRSHRMLRSLPMVPTAAQPTVPERAMPAETPVTPGPSDTAGPATVPQPTETSGPSPTALLSDTPGPTLAAEPTQMAEPPQTPEPASTSQPGESPEPGDEPKPTKNLVPPGQTKTPLPPGRIKPTKTPKVKD